MYKLHNILKHILRVAYETKLTINGVVATECAGAERHTHLSPRLPIDLEEIRTKHLFFRWMKASDCSSLGMRFLCTVFPEIFGKHSVIFSQLRYVLPLVVAEFVCVSFRTARRVVFFFPCKGCIAIKKNWLRGCTVLPVTWLFSVFASIAVLSVVLVAVFVFFLL